MENIQIICESLVYSSKVYNVPHASAIFNKAIIRHECQNYTRARPYTETLLVTED